MLERPIVVLDGRELNSIRLPRNANKLFHNTSQVHRYIGCETTKLTARPCTLVSALMKVEAFSEALVLEFNGVDHYGYLQKTPTIAGTSSSELTLPRVIAAAVDKAVTGAGR